MAPKVGSAREEGKRPVSAPLVESTSEGVAEKPFEAGVLVIERDLFRRSDQGREDFVNRTQVSITRDDE
jgi:hypothetical protein